MQIQFAHRFARFLSTKLFQFDESFTYEKANWYICRLLKEEALRKL